MFKEELNCETAYGKMTVFIVSPPLIYTMRGGREIALSLQ